MRTRRIVAALLLAMLPLFGVVSTAALEPVGQPADWAYAVGMDAEEALVFAVGGIVMCSLIPNPGAIACGLVGAF